MNVYELFPRRARVLVGSYAGRVGNAVGRDDPRVKAHPQPGHQAWEVFLFFDGYEGGHGVGYKAEEVEFIR